MPAHLVEREAAFPYARLSWSDSLSGKWERYFRNTGILLGFAGIAILPLMVLPGVILIVSGMEFLWLASPGLV